MQVLLDRRTRSSHLQLDDGGEVDASRRSLTLLHHCLMFISIVYIVAGVFIFALVTCQAVMTDVLSMETRHVHEHHVSVCE